MKIYTKFVCQWQPDGTLKQVPEECESFEYEGPLALAGKDEQYMANPIAADYQYGAKSRTPQQPDYVGAANAQSAGSIGTAIANSMMSHPNVTSPFGSSTWKRTGSNSIFIPGLGNIDIPEFSQSVQMAPEQQQIYGNAMSSIGKPLDLQSVQDVSDKAYGAMTSRLDPQWSAREQQQKTQLANQGLVPGGEAYDNAMRDFNNSRNDAYQQANLAAIQTMPQTYQIAAQQRDLPLNEFLALRSGTQVQAPNAAQGTAQGPNTLQAMQGQAGWQQAMYNQQVAQQNATNQGLMGLGSAAMMMFA